MGHQRRSRSYFFLIIDGKDVSTGDFLLKQHVPDVTIFQNRERWEWTLSPSIYRNDFFLFPDIGTGYIYLAVFPTGQCEVETFPASGGYLIADISIGLQEVLVNCDITDGVAVLLTPSIGQGQPPFRRMGPEPVIQLCFVS